MKPKNNLMKTFFFHFAAIAFCGSLLTGASPVFGEEVTIIANSSVTIDSLAVEDLRAIFLGTKTIWNDGQRIVFAMMPDDPAHTQLLKKHIKRTGNQFMNHWKKLVFTGNARMPAIFNKQEDLNNFVRTTPGSIGYMSPGSIPENVKALEVK